MQIFIGNISYPDIKDGSKVIVYGAGKIGELIIEKILYSNRLKLLSVIDKNPENKLLGIEVKKFSLEESDLGDFDYIIIALQDAKLINDIKNELISKGVETTKIIYSYDISNREEGIFEYEKMLERNIKSQKRKVVVFKLPEHGNTGDYVIGLAEKAFFRKYFDNIGYFEITTEEWFFCKDKIKSIISPDDILCINGGGYLGDLWGEKASYEDITEAFPQNYIFFMPNSFAYSQTDYFDKAYFEEDMLWFKKNKNVFVFLRDENSFLRFSHFCENGRLYPDMAFFLHMKKKNNTDNGKYLLCFRDDREKKHEVTEIIKKELEENAILYDEFDIYIKRFVLQENSEALFRYVSEKFQEYKLVITDRLHGMIISVISDVPCIVFDNTTGKISGVYRWIEKSGLAVFLNPEEAYKINDFANKAICSKKKAGDFKPFSSEFDDMAQYIKSIIGGETS